MAHISDQINTIEGQVRERITQLIADNPRLKSTDYVILETAALIGVSVTMDAMDRYEESLIAAAGELENIPEEVFDETKLR